MEFLVTMTTHLPDGTPAGEVDDVGAREAAHTRELAAQGHVLRLWRPPLVPGEWRTLGSFAASDAAELERVLASMPLRVPRPRILAGPAGRAYSASRPSAGCAGQPEAVSARAAGHG